MSSTTSRSGIVADRDQELGVVVDDVIVLSRRPSRSRWMSPPRKVTLIPVGEKPNQSSRWISAGFSGATEPMRDLHGPEFGAAISGWAVAHALTVLGARERR
jgi:hypothetical protein